MQGYLEKGIQHHMAQGRCSTFISKIEWIRTSGLSIKNSLCLTRVGRLFSSRHAGFAVRGTNSPTLKRIRARDRQIGESKSTQPELGIRTRAFAFHSCSFRSVRSSVPPRSPTIICSPERNPAHSDHREKQALPAIEPGTPRPHRPHNELPGNPEYVEDPM